MAQKAMIGMSGGVDSSVAAYLTQQAGYQCIGATMRLYEAEGVGETNTHDAENVAQRLNMPFCVFDMTQDFRRCVTDHFAESYESGLTPNPCVVCNRNLKFSKFLEQAQQADCDYIVTGHYARIEQNQQTGRFELKKAVDTDKDQTYFLYCLTQEQLSHTLFPLGALTKTEVRDIAQAQGFLNAKKKDSQDICFVPDGDYVSFLKRYTGKNYPAGNYLDLQGNVVGKHEGAIDYTLGQRKGLGIALGSPVYVCAKDMASNTVTVGPNEALYRTALLADDWNWITIAELDRPMQVMAKARSRMTEQPATVYPLPNGVAKVEFNEPQRALTPGQAIVLYQSDSVVGGGTIREIL